MLHGLLLPLFSCSPCTARTLGRPTWVTPLTAVLRPTMLMLVPSVCCCHLFLQWSLLATKLTAERCCSAVMGPSVKDVSVQLRVGMCGNIVSLVAVLTGPEYATQCAPDMCNIARNIVTHQQEHAPVGKRRPSIDFAASQMHVVLHGTVPAKSVPAPFNKRTLCTVHVRLVAL
jgi:hypothetical protein